MTAARPDPKAESARFMTVDAFDVRVRAGTDDRAEVVKDHSGPLPPLGRTRAEHDAAVERERAWLRAAAGIEGVVRFIEDRSGVVTEFAGAPTLRSHCPGPDGTADALASVADTVAALSARKLGHGSIAPEHVILSGDGSAVLCSPNTSDQPGDDLIGLADCLEFATEQWAQPPENLTHWLVLAKQLRNLDEPIDPTRAARTLRDLGSPRSPDKRLPRKRLAVLTACAVIVACGAAASTFADGTAPVDGPEVIIEGHVVRVGRAGHVALAHPGDSCQPPAIFLLDPTSSRVWTFDRFDGRGSATPLAVVPGAIELFLSAAGDDGCAVVNAGGPAGSVRLR
ncbi:MAG: hypothetical protein HKN24_04070 [Acidimicrobiales bacterium]|nr:hypothetical protein [Acidimicrobiales bacterium]